MGLLDSIVDVVADVTPLGDSGVRAAAGFFTGGASELYFQRRDAKERANLVAKAARARATATRRNRAGVPLARVPGRPRPPPLRYGLALNYEMLAVGGVIAGVTLVALVRAAK